VDHAVEMRLSHGGVERQIGLTTLLEEVAAFRSSGDKRKRAW